MTKYHLTLGNRLEHEYLQDCESDHIEVAEHEAEQALYAVTGEESVQPEYGSMGVMVRVIDEDEHCVYAAYGRKLG